MWSKLPAWAVRPDMYRSCTWLGPLRFPSGESTLTNRDRSHRRWPTWFFEALRAWQTAQQHRQHILQRLETSTRMTIIWCKSEDRCGAFLRVPHSKCKFQLYFYLCPRAQHSWQNTWVTSDWIIHSSSCEKSVFSGAFATKWRSVDTPEKFAKIVHASRNNTPFIQE